MTALRRSFLVPLLFISYWYPKSSAAQTFVQITNLGNNVPRVTRARAREQFSGNEIFGGLGGGATIQMNGTVYQFITDPIWNRLIFVKMDKWIRPFTNEAGPGGILQRPMDVDVSQGGMVYIADASGGRVLAGFFTGEGITPVGAIPDVV